METVDVESKRTLDEKGVDRTGQVGLRLNDVSAGRIDRLRLRNPRIGDWPVIERLYFMCEARGDTIDITREDLDALVAMLQLLNAECELPEDVFDFVLDVVVAKIKNKGGASCQPSQIADITYEGQVSLLFAALMPGWVKIEPSDKNKPDHVFHVSFYMSPEPSKIAIECKNLRTNFQEVRDLVRSVTSAIGSAVAQHKKRAEEFTDLVIFIDLPVGFLARTTADYHALIVNVFEDLKHAGHSVDESQVIFTATSQAGMADHILYGSKDHRNLVLLRPVTVGKQNIAMRAPRAVFLSFLTAAPGEAANIQNWSKVAINIVDPEAYVFK